MIKPLGSGTAALRKGRHSQENGAYFVTLLTDQRIPWFLEFDLACVMCRCASDETCFDDATNLCWVVMPDHVHLLLQLANSDLSKVIQRVKGRSARLLNRKIGRRGRFWARGFHDHGLRKERSMVHIARYIVANPVRAGLSTKVGGYPYWDATWL